MVTTQPESSLTVAADLKELGAIRQFIEETANDLDASQSAIDDLLLAITEIVTNIIVHGYKGDSGIIEISLRRQRDLLIIRLLDQAPPFDPTSIAKPNINLPLEQRPLGGMGIFLTMQVVDDAHHRVTSHGGNELILVKKANP